MPMQIQVLRGCTLEAAEYDDERRKVKDQVLGKPGDKATVPNALGRMLVGSKKAIELNGEEPAAPPVMSTKSAKSIAK